MKPNHKLAEAITPDGARLTLHERDRVYSIRLNGRSLMDSSAAASEILLGELAVARIPARTHSRILLGGLGLGFTLRRVLEIAGSDSVVDVVELIPAVVHWNREHLLDLNGASLRDPRVRVIIDDVWDVISQAPDGRYDAIALDLDNGPIAMVQRQNARVYDRQGVAQIVAALRPGGRVAIWSAGREHDFDSRLTSAGLRVQIVPAKSHAGAKQHACTIYVADKTT